MGIGVKIAQTLLFAFNFLFVLIGLASIIVGAIIKVKYEDYEDLSSKNIGGVSVLLIALGGIIFIVAFFGCCGAIRKNVVMLTIYVVLMVILLIIEIAGAITAYVYKNKVKDYIKDGMENALDHYNDNSTEGADYRKAWNTVQKEFHCCGIDGVGDYVNHTSGGKKDSIEIPMSCCGGVKNQTEHCSKKNAYSEGCVDKLFDYLDDHLAIVGGLAVAVAIIQIVGIVFACIVRHNAKEGYGYV